MNFLDVFVQRACSKDERRGYQRTVLRLFLADRVAMGSVALLRCYGLVFRVLVVVVAVWVGGGVLRTDGEHISGSWVSRGLVAGFLCIGWGWLESRFL